MKKRKELFLDYGGLIFEHKFNNATLSRAHNLALKFLYSRGYRINNNDLRNAHDEVIADYLISREKNDVEWSMNKIIGGVVGKLKLDEVIVSSLVEIYKIHDHDYFPMATTKKTLPLLSQEFNLHIISNVPHDSIYSELNNYNMLKFFDTFTLSGDVGFRKPCSKIYNIARKKAGISSSDGIFVSHDDIEVEGAKKVGMHGFLAKSLEEVVEVLQ